MCVSAAVSFGMAGLLTAGGALALRKALQADKHYVPLAVFPVFVGVQQAIEGGVWLAAEAGAAGWLRLLALGYLFFVWMVWPVWVPYMTANLESKTGRRHLFHFLALAGFLLGLILYLPNFWNPDWLRVWIVHRSIAYQCTFIVDPVVSRTPVYLLYLFLVVAAPLLSSHRALNIFGIGLAAFVPLTYFFFSYADISVLCFFAAITTLYILHLIVEDRCAQKSMVRLHGFALTLR